MIKNYDDFVGYRFFRADFEPYTTMTLPEITGLFNNTGVIIFNVNNKFYFKVPCYFDNFKNPHLPENLTEIPCLQFREEIKNFLFTKNEKAVI